MRANGVLLTWVVRNLFKIDELDAGCGERAKAFLASLSICVSESSFEIIRLNEMGNPTFDKCNCMGSSFS